MVSSAKASVEVISKGKYGDTTVKNVLFLKSPLLMDVSHAKSKPSNVAVGSLNIFVGRNLGLYLPHTGVGEHGKKRTELCRFGIHHD